MVRRAIETVVIALCFVTGTAHAAKVDLTYMQYCKSLLTSGSAPALLKAMEEHAVTRKLRQGWGDAYKPNLDLEARAERTLETIALVESDIAGLIDGAHAARTLLPAGAIPENVRVHFICGSPSDGYGFTIDGEKQLFIDVSNVRAEFLPHLMKHEFWHVGFKRAFPAMFEEEFYASDPRRRVAYQMLNEGVGHYYSMRRRLVPTNTYPDWPERTASIFALLHEKLPEVTAAKSNEAQNQLIYRGHAGVPFWQKWLAVTGAIVTYRLISSDGEAAVAALIAAGPCAFLSRYQSLADPDGENRLPDALTEAACQ